MAINVAVTLRSLLTRALSWAELDNNFTAIKAALSGAASDADLASPASGKGASLIGYSRGTTVDVELQRLGDGAVWVTDPRYGAVGDFNGTTGTDNYSAFVVAANAAAAKPGGGTLWIPDGRFYLGAEWTPPAGITIAGAGTIEGNSALPPNSKVIKITNSNITIRGIKVSQNNIYSGRSIWISNAANITIDRVRSANVQSAFIEVMAGSSNITITGCEHFGGGYGVITSDSGAGYVHIVGNRFRHGGTGYAIGDGIAINNPLNGNEHFLIAYNYVSGYKGASSFAGLGISIAKAKYGSVIGNVVEFCEADGIHVEDDSAYIVVDGNTVNQCCSDVTYGTAAILLIYADNCTVSNNSVFTAAGGHGIMVTGFGRDRYVNNNKIIGNTVNGAREAGIFLNTCNRTIVALNTIEGVNSGNAGFAAVDLRKIGGATKQNLQTTITGNILTDGGTAAVAAIMCEAGDTGSILDNDMVQMTAKLTLNGAAMRVRGNRYNAAAVSGTVTLTAGTTTVIANPNAWDRSRIVLQPANASAAALASAFVSGVAGGTSFSITHSTAAGTEQFFWTIE